MVPEALKKGNIKNHILRLQNQLRHNLNGDWVVLNRNAQCFLS